MAWNRKNLTKSTKSIHQEEKMMPRYLSDRSEDSQSILLGSKDPREKDERDRSEIILHIVPRGIHYKMREEQYAPRRNIVLIYARLGLHRYNFLQGTNLQLSRVEKYIKSWGSAASTYFITLKAKDPAETSGSLQTFQAQVNEQKYGRFLLMCTMARPLGGEINRNLLDNKYLGHFMPELPSENPFKKTDRFYVEPYQTWCEQFEDSESGYGNYTKPGGAFL